MATYTIDYAYTIGDSVWIIDGDHIIESTVRRIILEVDPDEHGNVNEKRTYHIDPVYDKRCTLFTYDESILFPSLESILNYRATGILPIVPRNYEHEYYYTLNDTVWVIEVARALESNVEQITINISSNANHELLSDTWYHVLPNSVMYSVRILKYEDIYETKQDAIDKIIEDREPGTTPTPTPTPEVTPEVTPTMTVTPTPTVTPSPVLPIILLEDYSPVLLEDYSYILLE